MYIAGEVNRKEYKDMLERLLSRDIKNKHLKAGVVPVYDTSGEVYWKIICKQKVD